MGRLGTRRRALTAALSFVMVVGGVVVAGAPPAAAVAQSGPRNFAGPSSQCPGAGWNCYEIDHDNPGDAVGFVQTTSGSGGRNVFVCIVAACSVRQVATGGASNEVNCDQTSLRQPSTYYAAVDDWSCMFVQENDSGSNSATVTQIHDDTDPNPAGSVQTPTQAVDDSSQSNDTGTNTAQIHQETRLNAGGLSLLASPSRVQNPLKVVNLTQTDRVGAQQAQISQVTRSMITDVLSLSIEHLQDTFGAAPASDVNLTQNNTSGATEGQISQLFDVDASAVSITGLQGGLPPLLPPSRQHQGDDVQPAGNIVFDVNSPASSQIQTSQNQTYDQVWAAVVLPITTEQVQFGRFNVVGSGATQSQITQDTDLRMLLGLGGVLPLGTSRQECDHDVDVVNDVDGTARSRCSESVLLGEVLTGPTESVQTDSGTHLVIHNNT